MAITTNVGQRQPHETEPLATLATHREKLGSYRLLQGVLAATLPASVLGAVLDLAVAHGEVANLDISQALLLAGAVWCGHIFLISFGGGAGAILVDAASKVGTGRLLRTAWARAVASPAYDRRLAGLVVGFLSGLAAYGAGVFAVVCFWTSAMHNPIFAGLATALAAIGLMPIAYGLAALVMVAVRGKGSDAAEQEQPFSSATTANSASGSARGLLRPESATGSHGVGSHNRLWRFQGRLPLMTLAVAAVCALSILSAPVAAIFLVGPEALPMAAIAVALSELTFLLVLALHLRQSSRDSVVAAILSSQKMKLGVLVMATVGIVSPWFYMAESSAYDAAYNGTAVYRYLVGLIVPQASEDLDDFYRQAEAAHSFENNGDTGSHASAGQTFDHAVDSAHQRSLSDSEDSGDRTALSRGPIPDHGTAGKTTAASTTAASTTAASTTAASTTTAARTTTARTTTATTAESNRPNILMILVDTVRADHLGCYGYDRPTSPNTDAMAGKGVRFVNAYAQSPHTPRSIPSIFTSRHPSEIAFHRPGASYPFLKDENITFAEALQSAGYFTVAVTSHFYFGTKYNIRQGFDLWDNHGALTIAGSNTDTASPRILVRVERKLSKLRQVNEDGRPFFLFVHLFEPHSKYVFHPEGHDFGRKWMDLYDNEISFADIYVGKLLKVIEDAGFKMPTAVVLLSDHGEGMKEHGHYWHGQHIYNEVLHVPLLWEVPGVAPGAISAPVALLDVAPTLLDIAGAPIPEVFRGRSLLPLMKGHKLPDRPIYAELLPYPHWKEHAVAVLLDGWKLIHNRTKRTWELFDLTNDPREQSNLFHTKADKAAELKELIDQWLRRSRKS